MAAYETDRLKIWRWESDTDDFIRSQMDDSHDRLEDKAAIFTADSVFPSGGGDSQRSRSFHLDTSNNVLYYSFSDGASWRPLNLHAAPTTTLNPGSSNTAGTALSISRSDHTHALPAFGAVGQISPVVTTASAGVATTFARSDHAHAIGVGAINSAEQFVNLVVPSEAINDNAITTGKILNSNVTREKIVETQRIPVGAMMPYAGTDTPSGWAICNGASQSTTDPAYAALFGVIGYGYGGSGANFNLPDLTNRIPRGAGSVARGAATGSDSINLVAANIPAHSHGVNLTAASAGSHVHSLADPPTNTVRTDVRALHQHSVNTNGSHDHGISTGRKLLYDLPGSPIKLALTSSDISIPVSTDTFAAHSGHVHSMNDAGAHQHALLNSTQAEGSHVHSVSGATANFGSGTTVDITPQCLGVNYIIKL
jgi:microcystin-dependent protein